MMRRAVGTLGAVCLLAAFAQAHAAATWPAASFDQPLAVQTLKPIASADPAASPSPEVICTTYADLTIRESGTDTPDPDPPIIIRRSAGSSGPVCASPADTPAVGVPVPGGSGLAFLGRAGSFLIFQASDPNGATPFLIVDAATARALYADSTKDADIASLFLDEGTLRMRFKRGVNSTCSLVADGAKCWTKLVKDGLIPVRVGQGPAPIRACKAAYRHTKTPASDPSLIFYDVDIALAPSGKVDTAPEAPVGCEPLP